MKAVILAAGEGTRMRPLTYSCPKVMLPVANKPILEHIMDAAIDAGIDEFVFVTGYRENAVKEYFGDGSAWNANIQYVTQLEQKGTADAIKNADGYVEGHFVVLNGDVLVTKDYLKKLVSKKSDAVITAKEVFNPSEFGVIDTSEEKVTNIVEKSTNPPTSLANTGIYLFHDSIFDYINKTPVSERGEIEITDSIQMMIDEGKQVTYELLDNEWIDIGRPWDMLDANKSLLQDIRFYNQGTVEPNATLKGDVIVGKNTVVKNGAYIEGPVIIGDNCDIGPNCYIRPSTSIGNHVKIGNAVEVKNTIVMDDTSIGHLAYVGDSVVGKRCNFGAGTKVANLRHDDKTIKSTMKGKLVDTSRRKLGVIMADDVHTGINTSINVGVVLERDTKPGEVVMK